jgi:hypothetical protein
MGNDPCLKKSILVAAVFGAAPMMIAAAQFNGVDSAKERSEFTPAISSHDGASI